jgi:hypothetical protein
MNGLILAVVALLGKRTVNNALYILLFIFYLVLAPVASAISCYYGTSITGYSQPSGYDVCYVSHF